VQKTLENLSKRKEFLLRRMKNKNNILEDQNQKYVAKKETNMTAPKYSRPS